MRKSLFCAVVTLSSLLYVSCGKVIKNVDLENSTTISDSSASAEEIQERLNVLYDRIKVDVVEGEFKEAPLAIEVWIVNQSQEVITVKDDYRICVLENKEWIPIDFGDLYDAHSSYLVGKGVSVKIEIPLYPEQVNFKKGHYRISKPISSEVGELEVDGYFSII